MNKFCLALFFSLIVNFSFAQTKKAFNLINGTWILESSYFGKFESKIKNTITLEMFKDGTYKRTETTPKKDSTGVEHSVITTGTWKVTNDTLISNPIFIDSPTGKKLDETTAFVLTEVTEKIMRFRFKMDSFTCENYFIRMK